MNWVEQAHQEELLKQEQKRLQEEAAQRKREAYIEQVDEMVTRNLADMARPVWGDDGFKPSTGLTNFGYYWRVGQAQAKEVGLYDEYETFQLSVSFDKDGSPRSFQAGLEPINDKEELLKGRYKNKFPGGLVNGIQTYTIPAWMRPDYDPSKKDSYNPLYKITEEDLRRLLKDYVLHGPDLYRIQARYPEPSAPSLSSSSGYDSGMTIEWPSYPIVRIAR